MITALLLLPVGAVLVWLYWYLLPHDSISRGRWRWIDSLLLIGVILAASFFHLQAMRADYHDAGPMFPELVSAAGSYSILAGGLLLSLLWRRKRAAGKG